MTVGGSVSGFPRPVRLSKGCFEVVLPISYPSTPLPTYCTRLGVLWKSGQGHILTLTYLSVQVAPVLALLHILPQVKITKATLASSKLHG